MNLDESTSIEQKYLRTSDQQQANHDSGIYVMDAHFKGNVSRFYNHSCSPNVFVQNVFIDTWDVRFPWVAFFTATNVKAGTELVWDYSYEVHKHFFMFIQTFPEFSFRSIQWKIVCYIAVVVQMNAAIDYFDCFILFLFL